MMNASLSQYFNLKQAAPFIALVVLILVGSLVHPNFLTYDNLVQNVATRTSFIAIIAIGATFVMSAGGLDLSVGSMAAFTAGTMILFLKSGEATGGAVLIAEGMVLAIAVGVLCGMANGAIVTLGRIEPFIATLGTMVILRSLFTYLANGGSLSISPDLKDIYAPVYQGTFLGLPIPVLVVLGVGALAALLLYKTPFGRHVLAVGSNEDVARYSGVSISGIKALTYAIQGLCVAIAVVLYVPRLGSANSATGLYWELQAITAVVVGGTLLKGGRGRIWGTIVGAFFLEIIGNILTLSNVNVYLIGAVQGAIIIVAMLIQRSLNRRTT
ncbi:MAG: ABC transporter permease [Alphaproteobacteria bacterium]|nr:ABC transporter permease [Alphaproteobacteria bacterium]